MTASKLPEFVLVILLPGCITIRLAACTVNVFAVDQFTWASLAKIMSPFSDPTVPDVVRVTLVVPKAVFRVALLRFDPVPVGTKGVVGETLLSPAALMVKSNGSSNQVPVLPVRPVVST